MLALAELLLTQSSLRMSRNQRPSFLHRTCIRRWQKPGKSALKQSARRTAVLADVRNVGLANIDIGSGRESVALTLPNHRVLYLRWRTAAEAAVVRTLFEALLAGGGGSAYIDQ